MEKHQLVDRIVRNSRAVGLAKLTLNELKYSNFYLSRLPFSIPDSDSVKHTMSQLKNRQDELERSIAKLLYILFEGKDWGFSEIKAHLSMSELRDGYILLEKPISIPRKVLFLDDYKHYKKGTIIEFEDIKHELGQQKSRLTQMDEILDKVSKERYKQFKKVENE